MIEEFIPMGYENRISRADLQSILHIPDREIRQQIEHAALRGVLILSSNGGYFRYQDERDNEYVNDYFRREEHRSRTHGRNVRRKKKLWYEMTGRDPKQVPGQMSLFKE